MRLLICAQVVDKNHPILGFFHAWLLEFSKYAGEIHVICLQRGEIDLPDNVFVYSLGKEEGVSKVIYMIRFYKYFVTIFFRKQITYVFFHMGAIYNLLASPFFLVRRLYGVSFYWWKAHGHINWGGRLALLFVDKVYTSTTSGFPIETPKRRIVGQAIDTMLFVPEPQFRQNKRVIYTGRISPVKNIETFVAVARLLEPLGYSFVIAGPVCDDVYAQKLQQEAKGTKIDFIGPCTQRVLKKHYQQAAFFLNPSATNSMDKTLLEAVLCGCVPVTSNIAFAEMLQDTNLLVENPTPENFASTITAYTNKNDTVVSMLRDYVVKNHSLKTFANRVFGK